MILRKPSSADVTALSAAVAFEISREKLRELMRAYPLLLVELYELATRREDEINAYVHAFEEATDRLKDRYEDRGTAPGLARNVLDRGRAIDRFMRRNRTGGRSEGDWVQVRNSLNKLAWAYNINWRW